MPSTLSNEPAATSDADAPCLQGRAVWERLYETYRQPIYNLCARITGDQDEALDLTQEVFVKALGSLPAEEDERRLRAWLYKVATNASLDHLRRRRAAPTTGAELGAEVPAAVDGFAQSELAGLVERTLGDLSDRERTALVLKDLHGMHTRELAGVLGVSRPTADVIVHRARRSFKKTFSRIAGGAPEPASLGLVLLPLALPAALRLPPAEAAVTLGEAASRAAQAAAEAGSLAAPVGGLLAKLAASLTAKVAVGAAAATLVVGGVVALERSVDRGRTAAGAGGSGAATAIRTGPHHDRVDPHHWERHQTADAHHVEATGHDLVSAAHDTDHDGSGDRTHEDSADTVEAEDRDGDDPFVSTEQHSTSSVSSASSSDGHGTTTSGDRSGATVSDGHSGEGASGGTSHDGEEH
jgi:RNA polymerase sigma-70 factor (ECF subfamily)